MIVKLAVIRSVHVHGAMGALAATVDVAISGILLTRGLRSLARLKGSAALAHRRAQRALLASYADRITGAAASLGSHTVDTAAHGVG